MKIANAWKLISMQQTPQSDSIRQQNLQTSAYVMMLNRAELKTAGNPQHIHITHKSTVIVTNTVLTESSVDVLRVTVYSNN